MHKPFDLDAAKRGNPIEVLDARAWKPAYFVGLSFAGVPFIQKILGSGRATAAFECPESDLRMAPKKVTVRYRVALCQGAHDKYVMAVQDSEQDPRLRACGFIDWLDADWQEVEIPQ